MMRWLCLAVGLCIPSGAVGEPLDDLMSRYEELERELAAATAVLDTLGDAMVVYRAATEGWPLGVSLGVCGYPNASMRGNVTLTIDEARAFAIVLRPRIEAAARKAGLIE